MKRTEISPSNALRIIKCPGSYQLNYGLKSTSTDYATQGTNYHALLECKIKHLIKGNPKIYKTSNLYKLTELTPDEVVKDLDRIIQYYNLDKMENYANLHSETKLKISTQKDKIPPIKGTCDIYKIVDNELVIIDYKSGMVEVKAEENVQLLLYAYGILTEHCFVDIQRVSLNIAQPSIDNFSEWVVTKEYIFDFFNNVFKPAVISAIKGSEKYHEGSWCTYCPGATQCPLKHEHLSKLTLIKHSPNDIGNHLDSISINLDRIEQIEKLIKAYKLQATIALQDGYNIPNYTLEGKFMGYEWIEDNNIDDMIASGDISNSVLHQTKLSPAQLKKVNPYDYEILRSQMQEKYSKPSLKKQNNKNE